MNTNQNKVFEGMVIVLLVLAICGWLIFQAFTKGEMVTSNTLPKLPIEALSADVLDKLATKAENQENTYGIPVAEPTEKGKTSLFE